MNASVSRFSRNSAPWSDVLQLLRGLGMLGEKGGTEAAEPAEAELFRQHDNADRRYNHADCIAFGSSDGSATVFVDFCQSGRVHGEWLPAWGG